MLKRVCPVRLLRVQRRRLWAETGEERAEEAGEEEADEEADDWPEAGEPPAELSGLRKWSVGLHLCFFDV